MTQIPSHLSYSQVSTWLHCGEQYRLTRIAGAEEHPSWWLSGGSAVHDATEEYDKGGLDEIFDPQVEFAAAFEKRRPSMEGRFAGLQPRSSGRGKEDDAWWLANGPQMVQSWIDWRAEEGWMPLHLTATGSQAVEVDVSGVIGDVPVKAYLDRVLVNLDGEAAIVDIKTGSRTPDSALQLGMYSYLLEQTTGLRVTTGGYWMARKGIVPEWNDLTKYTPRLLEQFVTGLAKARNIGLYVPKITPMCKSCGVNYACAAVGGEESDKYAGVGIDDAPATIFAPPF